MGLSPIHLVTALEHRPVLLLTLGVVAILCIGLSLVQNRPSTAHMLLKPPSHRHRLRNHWTGVSWYATFKSAKGLKLKSRRRWQAAVWQDSLWLWPTRTGFDFANFCFNSRDTAMRIALLDVVETQLFKGGARLRYLDFSGWIQEVVILGIDFSGILADDAPISDLWAS